MYNIKDFIELYKILESFDIENNKIVFNYNKKGDNSTSFGKGNFIPYIKADKIVLNKPVYSIYQMKGSDSSAVLYALKNKNGIEVNSDDYKQFINRTGLYAAKIISKNKIDVIFTPSSSSFLIDDIIENISKRLPHLKIYKSYFQKISKEDIKNIKIDKDNPKITDKIISSLTSIINKAHKDGYFEIKKVLSKDRRFLSGYLKMQDERIQKYITDKNVMVIDDIISTGNTLSEIFRNVLINGGNDVMGLTLFKTASLKEEVKIPDIGETVATIDRIKTKIYKSIEDTKGKPYTIEPNKEFEVIENQNQIVLKCKSGIIRFEIPEYKKSDFYLV